MLRCTDKILRKRKHPLVAVGDRVVVRRSRGELADDWTGIGLTQSEAVAHTIVQKVKSVSTLEKQKQIPRAELAEVKRAVRMKPLSWCAASPSFVCIFLVP